MADAGPDEEGYDVDQFEDDVDDFICGICQMVCRDICETKCGHIFCFQCIKSWLSKKQVCPVDQIPLPGGVKDIQKLARDGRKILNLKMKCINCDDVLTVKSIDDHELNKCKNTPIKCDLCGDQMPRGKLDEHLDAPESMPKHLKTALQQNRDLTKRVSKLEGNLSLCMSALGIQLQDEDDDDGKDDDESKEEATNPSKIEMRQSRISPSVASRFSTHQIVTYSGEWEALKGLEDLKFHCPRNGAPVKVTIAFVTMGSPHGGIRLVLDKKKVYGGNDKWGFIGLVYQKDAYEKQTIIRVLNDIPGGEHSMTVQIRSEAPGRFLKILGGSEPDHFIGSQFIVECMK